MNAPARIAPAAMVAPYCGFSARDFCERLGLGAFADMRVELVGGEFQKMAPASSGHSRQNFSIAERLITAFRTAKVGVEIGTDLAVAIDDTTVRGIDIAFSKSGFAAAGPTPASSIFLAVEIADTTLSRDLGEKVADYARVGIPHYWVVDLNGKAVHAMSEPVGQGYAQRSIVRFGEDLAVPGTDQTIQID